MWREECTKDKFCLEYDYPGDFTHCMWQKQERVLPIWIAYRVTMLAVVILAISVMYMIPEEDYYLYKNGIFFDHWAYLIEIMAFTIALAITVKRFLEEKSDPDLPVVAQMTPRYKLTWVIYTIAGPTSATVTILYWVFTTDPLQDPKFGHKFVTYTLNFLCMLVDTCLNAVPYRFLHFYMLGILCLVYGIFTLVYQECGGTGSGQIPIYKVMDWREPVQALGTAVSNMVFAMIAHCGFCLLHFAKLWLKRRMEQEQEE